MARWSGWCTASTAALGALLGGPAPGHAAALEQLWRLAYREASTLAYADAFRAIMLAFAVATLLVPLMRKVAAPKAPPTEVHRSERRNPPRAFS